MSSSGSLSTILIVDDDEDLRNLVAAQVRELGCACDFAADGRVGLEKALAQDYSVIVLDLAIPGLPGLDVCRALRAAKPAQRIVILSSKDSELDKVLGLDRGADDYITKPFSVNELMARLRVQLRRKAVACASDPVATISAEVWTFGELRIDVPKRKVSKAGKTVILTAKEFDLLVCLASRPGHPFTRQQILEQVWHMNVPEYEQNVSTLILRLRQKIETDPERPEYIETVRGIGYCFADFTGTQSES